MKLNKPSWESVELVTAGASKAIAYLEEPNTELWIIPVDFHQTRSYIVVSRGPNWEKCFKSYENHKIKQLKSIKNPLDEIL